MTNWQGILNRGMSHVPGRTELDCVRFHHAAQDGLLFKTHELFISEFFFLFVSYFWTMVELG